MPKDMVEMRQLWIQVNKGREAIGRSQTWPPTESPFPFNGNLTTLMLIVASDLNEVQRERETLTSSLSLLKMNITAYTLDAEQTVCGIVLYAELLNGESFSPRERTRRKYKQSDQGYIDDEKSCFWT